MDRLGRNMLDLLQTIKALTDRGVAVQFMKEHLTFSGEDSPTSKLQLGIMAAVAEFERSLIRERQREGIAIAKKKGVYKGRKVLSVEQAKAVVARDKENRGHGRAALARELGISRETLYQYLRQAA